MNRVRKMVFSEKEILVIDYSGCSGELLMAAFDEAKEIILTENKHCVILNIFDDRTFVSPTFMRHVETHLTEVDDLVDRQAIIGLSKIQESILKGMNLWYRRQVRSFKTKEEALNYLVNYR